MSIIYDALKKVEISQPGEPNNSKATIDRSSRPKIKTFLLYAILICLLLFVTNIFYEWLLPNVPLNMKTYSQPASKVAPAPAPNVSADTIIVSAKETSPKSAPAFILSGVFFSGAEGSALINNRIVKKGDKIDGATVVGIFLEEVELDFEGSKIQLSNSAK